MPDSNNPDCPDNGFKIFTFTESEIENIAAQYQTTSTNGFWGIGAWSAKSSYSDGTITYKIDPSLIKDTTNIPSYVTTPDASHPNSLINKQLSNISTLLGIPITQVDDGSADMNFSEFGAWDFFTTSEGFMGQNKNKIKFNPQVIYNVTNFQKDIPLDEALNASINHEFVHFLGLDHPEASNSEILKELGEFFQSSLITNAKSPNNFDYNTKVIAPLDVYMLQKEMGRDLNYIDYYSSTGNLIQPQSYIDGNGNKVLRINLGELAIDKETAIFEMPRKNPDGSSAGDIAIMTSTGFFVIPGALSPDYSGVDISFTSQNGDPISLSNVKYKSGATLSLQDVKGGLNEALNGMPTNWLNLANSRVQNGSMPELDKILKNGCTSSYLPEQTDIQKFAAEAVNAISGIFTGGHMDTGNGIIQDVENFEIQTPFSQSALAPTSGSKTLG